jgi:hypothetical protein
MAQEMDVDKYRDKASEEIKLKDLHKEQEQEEIKKIMQQEMNVMTEP